MKSNISNLDVDSTSELIDWIPELSAAYISPGGDISFTEKSTTSGLIKDTPKSVATFDKQNKEFEGQVIIQNFIEIINQRFYIELEEGHIYLNHYKWSLVGMGSNLGEAIVDLRNEAKELLLEIKDDHSKELLDLKDFLFAFV